MSSKSEYDKKFYQKNHPYPIRLGELKAKLKIEAFENNECISDTTRRILNNHFDKKEYAEAENLIDRNKK